ncbi:Uncharacterised protein [Bacteroides thetaiotaomicron]|jgi:hypothetical protein|nr:hypothetical protein [Bacteroides thetaiotaomicron]CUN26946.1 Uncharacterised protein [Bacteroides thetaiotaomicron]
MITYYIMKELAKWGIKGRIDRKSSLYQGFKLYSNIEGGNITFCSV